MEFQKYDVKEKKKETKERHGRKGWGPDRGEKEEEGVRGDPNEMRWNQ